MAIKDSKKWDYQDSEELFQTILRLKNLEKAKKFLRDLLTENEILEFSQRWKVARMLDAKIPYTEIEKKTGMSSTTIARIQNWIKNGKGGYQLMLKCINNSKK